MKVKDLISKLQQIENQDLEVGKYFLVDRDGPEGISLLDNIEVTTRDVYIWDKHKPEQTSWVNVEFKNILGMKQ